MPPGPKRRHVRRRKTNGTTWLGGPRPEAVAELEHLHGIESRCGCVALHGRNGRWKAELANQRPRLQGAKPLGGSMVAQYLDGESRLTGRLPVPVRWFGAYASVTWLIR